MATTIHVHALCESKSIGDKTRIGAFTHVCQDARIGNDCDIGVHVVIEGDVVLGNRVIVKAGAQLSGKLCVDDDVCIGTHVTLVKDHRDGEMPPAAATGETRLCQGVSIGANATILPGLVVGRNAVVSAGSVVTRPIPPNAIVSGNPARIVGYVDAGKNPKSTLEAPAPGRTLAAPEVEVRVRGVTFHRFRSIHDLRGDLSVGEFLKDIPLTPKRYFVVTKVPSTEIRGEHAHRACQQFLICVAGSCSIIADDGVSRQEFVLTGPEMGLYIPPMTWLTQYKHSHDGVLLVFASQYYDEKDYIRDYECFLEEIRKGSRDRRAA